MFPEGDPIKAEIIQFAEATKHLPDKVVLLISFASWRHAG